MTEARCYDLLQFVAVGQLLIDFTGTVRCKAFDVGDWVAETGEILIAAGGTATHVCEGVQRAGGWRTLLISPLGAVNENGCLTPDDLGALALRHLDRAGIDHACELIASGQTSRAILLYPPDDGRFMLVDASVTRHLSANHIRACLTEAVRFSRDQLIYISGYMFFDKAFEEVIDAILDTAEMGLATVWVDVLPHDLYLSLDLDDFCSQASRVGMISLDQDTLDGFAMGYEGGSTALVSRLVSDGVTLAISSNEMISVKGPNVFHQIPFPALDLDRTAGARDRVTAEVLAGHVRSTLRASRSQRA